MKRITYPSVMAMSLATLCAQQLQWQVPVSGPSSIEYLRMAPFLDFDGDGVRDYLQVVYLPTLNYVTLRIASGQTGSALWSIPGYGMALPGASHAGDADGDGYPDIAILRNWSPTVRGVEVYSPHRGVALWLVFGTRSGLFGAAMLGDLDVNGDGWADLVTITSHPNESDVYVYGNGGKLLYALPCRSQGRIAISLAKMGDLDADGCDDFLVGCLDPTTRGLQWLVSGRTGATIRETLGLLPGDATAEHISNLGDIDGDGVEDYAAFPYIAAQRAIAVAFSGQTGAVIRSWTDFPNSVVTGEDFDQDGINDIVTGGDWTIAAPNVYGSTRCYSGRDGEELWRVDNFLSTTGHNGNTGWMETSASLGVQVGSPYPVVAWMDSQWWQSAIGGRGRTRAYIAARAGQGPVTGVACTSRGSLPRIGVRKLGVGVANTGSRITVAKTHSGALAALNIAFTALPTAIDLTGLGFANCTLYVDPDASHLRVTGDTGIDRGYAAVDLPHPLTAAVVGNDLAAQWLVFEPATLAYAATQMHALRLQ